MKRQLYILPFAIIIIACSKNDHIQPTSCSNIYYKDYNPDTNVHMPFLDTLSFYLDVNNDSLADMRFYLHHYYENYGPHYYDSYTISIIGTDRLQFISTAWFSGPCNSPLDTSLYISNTNQVQPSFQIEYIAPVSMIQCCSFSQKGYIGFRLNQNGQNYFGWIHLAINSFTNLIIDDFAMCLCPNSSIKIGQR